MTNKNIRTRNENENNNFGADNFVELWKSCSRIFTEKRSSYEDAEIIIQLLSFCAKIEIKMKNFCLNESGCLLLNVGVSAKNKKMQKRERADTINNKKLLRHLHSRRME